MSALKSLVQSQTRRIYRGLGHRQFSLGIDIGQVSTKIVSAEQNAGGKLSYRGVSLPTHTELLAAELASPGEDSIATNHAERTTGRSGSLWSTRAIKTLMSRVSQVVGANQRNHRLEVGVTLSMSACDYRTLYVPKNTRVSTAGVEQSIATALGDKRPRCIALIPGQESQSDAKQTKLRCFSLAEDLAWSVAQQLDDVGLTPSAINGLPWCVANALEMCAPSTQSAPLQVGIDWSYGSPTLVTVNHGKLDYVRCLSSGGLAELFSHATSQFGMTSAQAGRWLEHCLQTPTPRQADAVANESRDWARNVCTQLAAEIEVAMDFIKWRNQGIDLNTIYLMGGATRIAGLSEMLQSMLVCQLKPWKLEEASGELTPDFALAASLAWMGLQHA